MLSFDIETTGLSPYRHEITVAAVYDEEAGISRVYNFVRDRAQWSTEVEAFLKDLDEADCLCAFNGMYFDIPFIKVAFQVHPDRVAMWALKTIDVFYWFKHMHNRTFSLDRLLRENSMETKTSKGSEAIVMARQGRWKELEDYCMQDTVLTHSITKLRHTLRYPV